MESGKDYFTAKTPLTTLAQLEQAKAACIRTGRRYFCYFSERLQSECALYAGELVKKGAIGRVIQVLGLGPHRLTAASRPEWFFQKAALWRNPLRYWKPSDRAISLLYRR